MTCTISVVQYYQRINGTCFLSLEFFFDPQVDESDKYRSPMTSDYQNWQQILQPDFHRLPIGSLMISMKFVNVKYAHSCPRNPAKDLLHTTSPRSLLKFIKVIKIIRISTVGWSSVGMERSIWESLFSEDIRLTGNFGNTGVAFW